MSHYSKAQEGHTKLKEAIYDFLNERGEDGATNVELGRALGIYTGYSTREGEPDKKAQEGHLPRTILGYMETEEDDVVYLKDDKWFLRKS